MKSAVNILLDTLTVLLFSLSLGLLLYIGTLPQSHALPTVEEILAMPAEKIEPYKAALALTLHAGVELEIETTLNGLDQLARELKPRIRRHQTGKDKIKEIGEYLRSKGWYFGHYEHMDPQNILLDLVIRDRRGDCNQLSLLYVELAKRLNLPLKTISVLEPFHVMLLYQDEDETFFVEPLHPESELPSPMPKERYVSYNPIPLDNKEQLSITQCELANEFYYRRQYDKAITAYELGLKLYPNNSKIIHYLGILYDERGDNEKGLEYALQTIALVPDYAPGYLHWGRCYITQEKWQESIKATEKALLYNPFYSDAFNNIGVCLDKLNDATGAIECYEMALACNPIDKNALYNMGRYYYIHEQTDQAKPYLETLRALYPNMLYIYPMLVECYFLNNQPYEAWETILQVQKRGVELPKNILLKICSTLSKRQESLEELPWEE